MRDFDLGGLKLVRIYTYIRIVFSNLMYYIELYTIQSNNANKISFFIQIFKGAKNKFTRQNNIPCPKN